MDKILTMTITAFMLIVTAASALAFSVQEGQFYSKNELPTGTQQTSIGQTLECSPTPDKTTYVWKNRDNLVAPSMSVSCDGGLINEYTRREGDTSWNYVTETSSPFRFNLDPDKDYMFECYKCPDGSTCQSVGQRELINYYSFAECKRSGYVRYWEQTVCDTSTQILNVATWRCQDKPQDVCEPYWTATTWSECNNGIQTRQVQDENNCNTNNGRPLTSQSCTTQVECYTTSDCSFGFSCNNNQCIENPPLPETCEQGQLSCGTDNNLYKCEDAEQKITEICEEGCDYQTGQSEPSCIRAEKDVLAFTVLISVMAFTLFAVIGSLILFSSLKKGGRKRRR